MGFITQLFDVDFAALVPKMSTLLGLLQTLIVLALLAGPVAMAVLGGMYLWKPAKEANYKYGYRTYFGMGGVEAWRFTQKIAGLIFVGLGGVLAIAMVIVLILSGGDLLQRAITAAICLCVQAGLVLTARLVVAILARVYFDKNGERRR